MEKFSVEEIFGDKAVLDDGDINIGKPVKNRNKKKTLIYVISTLCIFALFFCFLLKQNSYVYLSHDDYGYATLSYVYWEEGMWGQNFNLEQLTHYLTEHYNRWGGRILGFAQEIILLQQGTWAMRAFNAFAVFISFALALCIAQRGKKSKILPLSALFTVGLFGFLGEGAALRGMYWYTASILYTIPVMYIFAGALILYITVFGSAEKNFSISKILMIPFCTVMFFFGAFSLEQVGIAAVMIAAAITVYTAFKFRNPLMMIYTIPPLASSLYGYHILLTAVGNNNRKSMYSDYYSKSFMGQILTSGKNIVETLFQPSNIAFVILIAAVTITVAILLVIKYRKNIFYKILCAADIISAVISVIITAKNLTDNKCDIFIWCYLALMALTVSIWLFSSKNNGDFVIWSIFFGGLVSQAACLIAPIYYESCFIIFFMTFVVVCIRLFAELTNLLTKKSGICICSALAVLITVIGSVNALKIYFGFKQNVRVQEYNNDMLVFAGEVYCDYGYAFDKLPLMKLKNETYTGDIMPYGRDLIKDWMKIYYKLPENLTYDDFEYEEYSDERLAELEEQLKNTKAAFAEKYSESEE